MTERHKYADAITAWANGETIQVRRNSNITIAPVDKWQDFIGKGQPEFCDDYWEWRIKPKHEWDVNTTITLKLPTPEHALALYGTLATSHNEKVKFASRASAIHEEQLDRDFEVENVSSNLYNQFYLIEQSAIDAYKEKHNL